MLKNMINEAESTRRFKNLISTSQMAKWFRKYGYEGQFSEQAIYSILDKYGIKPKTKRDGKSYFNKKNAIDCLTKNIFELKNLAEKLEQERNAMFDNEYEAPQQVGYGREDMSVASRELLANDGVFGSDENELYRTNENIFSFNNIVNEILNKC